MDDDGVAGEAGAVLLVFRVEGREHALPAADVAEVVRMVASTPLPEAPDWVAGVINFRGRVIPLVDVRTRLGAPPRDADLATPIIVVAAGDSAAGMVVDEVVEVLTVSGGGWGPLEAGGAPGSAVAGVTRSGNRLIVVLDPERLCADSAGLLLDAAEAV